MSQTIQIVVTVNYDPEAYAKHLGAWCVVDRDLPTKVFASLAFVIEEPVWDVPRGTVIKVSDWWVK